MDSFSAKHLSNRKVECVLLPTFHSLRWKRTVSLINVISPLPKQFIKFIVWVPLSSVVDSKKLST